MWFNNLAARAAFRTANSELEMLQQAGFPASAVARIQQQKLASLWDRAASVPHYRTMPEFGARDLSRLPITRKDQLKRNPGDFVRTDIGSVAKYYESSGSSGLPTPTPRMAEDIIHNVIGVCGMWRRALGGEPCRVAALLPSDVVPVADFVASACEYLGHTLLRCYPFCVGMCDWDRLEQLFAGYRPDRLFAAPGVLMQWTRILKRRGSLPRIRASVATILLLGEVCLPGQRRKLASEWAADVLDASYGSTETGTIAASCERGGLHLLLTGHIVELRRRDVIVPATPGASGELIDTTLSNYARPLLRYATGDVADVLPGPCPCGVPLPTVRVHGRQADGVALRGIRLTEHLVGSLVYDDPRLTGYLVQLREDGTGGRLLLEKDVDVTDAEGDLIASARKRFFLAGIDWDDIAIVSQLPASSKAGGSQKSWKRTNVVIK